MVRCAASRPTKTQLDTSDSHAFVLDQRFLRALILRRLLYVIDDDHFHGRLRGHQS